MSKPFFYNASPETFSLAGALRKDMTSAEKMLWRVLRRNNFKGYYFRRQHPIDYYVADFYCHAARLVIEVDGDIHELPDVKARDEARTAAIEKFGLKVLRIKNDDVFKNMHFVSAQIEKALMESEVK